MEHIDPPSGGRVDILSSLSSIQRSPSGQSVLVFDGQCHFCRGGVRLLLGMDVFQVLRVVDYQQVADLAAICPGLNYQSASRQMHLLESDGTYSAGFFAFRRLCWKLPWLYLLIPVVYLPGMVLLGPGIYCLIAKLRFLFSSNRCCGRDACSYPGSVP